MGPPRESGEARQDVRKFEASSPVSPVIERGFRQHLARLYRSRSKLSILGHPPGPTEWQQLAPCGGDFGEASTRIAWPLSSVLSTRADGMVSEQCYPGLFINCCRARLFFAPQRNLPQSHVPHGYASAVT
jgi:hypothetical protein